MTTRLNRWLLALIVIVGVPYYWLLIDDRPGPVEPHPVSIRQLRDLARSVPGLPPTRISYERVASRLVPRTFLAAGQGEKLERFSVHAYRLEVPDGRTIVIDSGLSAAARRNSLGTYRADAQARVTAELKKAALVLTLSEDERHSGGIGLAGLTRPTATSDDDADCPGPRTLVAGVVEIPVCGQVMATRMLYVRLADGREYLLTGDVAPTMENVLQQAGPSRLMNGIVQHQDRSVLHRWLLTLGRLSKQAPDLIIVPGHAPLRSKDLHRGFPGARRA